MRWGLIPSWAEDATIGNKLANVRGETVAGKPSFRSAFKHRRCLIPASSFYEWKAEQGIKQPWYISLVSGEPVESCCIITTEANGLMRPIHDRMPVILDAGQWHDWLSPNMKQGDKLLPMIRCHDPASMQAWPVTRELNRIGLRDDAGLTGRI